MRRVLYIPFCLLMLCGMASCSKKKQSVDYNNLINIDVPLKQSSTTELPRISALFDTVEIRLESTGFESLVGEVGEIKICGDTMVIRQSDNTFILFDMNGRFIRKINRKGRGHGEYITIQGFDIDEANRQIVVNGGNRDMLRYTLDGVFVSQAETGFSFFDFALMPNGDFLFFTPFSHMEPNGLWQTDADFNFKRQLVKLEDYEVNVYTGGRALVHVNDSVIGFMGVENDNVFYHIYSDTIIPVYHVTSQAFEESEQTKTGENHNVPTAYKSHYFESDGLMMFTHHFSENDSYHSVRTFYDNKSGQVTYLYNVNYKKVDWEDCMIPFFTNNYKNNFFYVLNYGEIENDKRLSARYPDMNEESNPIIVIYRTKCTQ